MEKINETSTKKKRRPNPVARYFVAYFEDFGLRQIATILLLIAGILALVGICCNIVPLALSGFYIAVIAVATGMTECVMSLVRTKNRKAPAFKQALVGLIILVALLGLSLTGVIFVHVNGIAIQNLQ